MTFSPFKINTGFVSSNINSIQKFKEICQMPSNVISVGLKYSRKHECIWQHFFAHESEKTG
jgi:hypothetical protein